MHNLLSVYILKDFSNYGFYSFNITELFHFNTVQCASFFVIYMYLCMFVDPCLSFT